MWISLLLCICIIPFIGVIGALLANAISYLIIVVIRIKDVQHYIYLPINYKILLTSISACLLQAIIISIDLKYGLCMSVVSMITILFLHKNELNDVIINLRKI